MIIVVWNASILIFSELKTSQPQHLELKEISVL